MGITHILWAGFSVCGGKDPVQERVSRISSPSWLRGPGKCSVGSFVKEKRKISSLRVDHERYTPKAADFWGVYFYGEAE